MSQSNYNIPNASAPTVRAQLNTVFQSVVTQNSGGTAPSTTFANMIWYDTTNNQLKKRNEANSAWIVLGTVDETSGIFTPSGSVSPATQLQATWNTGTNTTESLISPAKLKNATDTHLEALADGSSGVRVQGAALGGISLGTVTAAARSYAEITGCAGCGTVVGDFFHPAALGTTVYLSFSTDDGSSWGSNQSVGAHPMGQGRLRVNLQTGAWTLIQWTSGTVASGTVTVPVNANAFRVLVLGYYGGDPSAWDFYCISGRV